MNMYDRPVPKIWRPAKPETDKRILDSHEIRSLSGAAHDPHIRLALILLFGTAARVGAILDLTWDRVDLEHRSINLRLPDSVTRKGRAMSTADTARNICRMPQKFWTSCGCRITDKVHGTSDHFAEGDEHTIKSQRNKEGNGGS
ncbi:hypothetical protein [Celeribacter sp.]|uniref:hypothetical protein n=1 Tax=Celeribacter sp. TaxID=1890673 RepID=UPI003A94125D